MPLAMPHHRHQADGHLPFAWPLASDTCVLWASWLTQGAVHLLCKQRGPTSALRALLEHRPEAVHDEAHGLTALHQAAGADYVDGITTLLGAG